LAVDGVSWRILLEDFQTACEQLGRGELVALPPRTTSFQRWAERLSEYARSDALQRELAYWLPATPPQVARLPIDLAGGLNTAASAQMVTVALNAEETQALLHKVHDAYHTQINDVLLTALAQACSRWTGEQLLLV